MALSAPKTWPLATTAAGAINWTEFDQKVGTSPDSITVVKDGQDMRLDFSAIPATSSGMVVHQTAGNSPYFQLSYVLTFQSVASAAQEGSQFRSGTWASNVKRGSVLHNVAASANTVLVRGHNGTTDVVLDGTGGTGLPVWTAGVATVVGTEYLVQVTGERGASTTTGKMKARFSRLSDGVQLAEGEDWALDAGAVGAFWSHHQTGKPGTAIAANYRITRVNFSDQAYAYLPAAAPANAAPTVTFDGPVTGAEPLARVPHAATASDPEGGALTYAWTVDSVTPAGALTTSQLAGAYTASASYRAPLTSAGATVTLRCTVTDSGGLTGTGTITDTVIAAPRRVRTASGMKPSARRASQALPTFDSKIRPWMMVYDSFDDIEDLTPISGGYSSFTAGADYYLQQAVGYTDTINGGYRNYLPIASAQWSLLSTMGRTMDYLSYRRSLVCTWLVGSGGADSYTTATYQAIAAGTYDQAVVDLVNSLPIGTTGPGPKRPTVGAWFQFYFAFHHEADNYGPTSDKAAYRAAMQRILNVATTAAIAKGASPYELGVGGLLLTAGMDDSTWYWWTGITSALSAAQMAFVVGFWDTYFKFRAKTGGGFEPEPFADKVVPHLTAMRAGGLTRFVLAETALGRDTRAVPDVLAGDNAQYETWMWTVHDTLLAQAGFEGVGMFAKPDGPASMHGSLFRAGLTSSPLISPPTANPLAVAVATMLKRFNRRGAGHPGSLGQYASS